MDLNGQTAANLLLGNEEHFQLAMQAGRVLFWVATADGRCELVSANWAERTGQPLDLAVGTGWLNVVDEADRQRVKDTIAEALAARSGFHLHYRLKQKAKPARWVVHNASPRTLPGGEFSGLIATLHDCADSHDGEVALQNAAKRVYDYVATVALSAVAINMNGTAVHCNQTLCAALDYPQDALLGKDWIDAYVVSEDRARVRRLINGDTPLSSLPNELEYSVDTRGGPRLFRWHLTLIRDFDGHPVSLTMMGSDITEWRRQGDDMRLTARVFETSNEAMLITDANNRIVSVNSSFTRLTGYTADEAIGLDPKILSSGRHDHEFYKAMWDEILTSGCWRGDIWDRRKDGTFYPKYLAISAIRDSAGSVTHYSAIFHDATERKAFEAELDHLAHFDELTDLPNRALLQDRVEQAVVAAERNDKCFALLFVDLDGFKPINDTHGHGIGDEVLRQVAQRLRQSIRSMDTAGRIGGDEFVIVLTDVRDVDTAAQVASKITGALREPYLVGPLKISLSASVGISVYPQDEADAKSLLRAADEAMYIAKRSGKDRVHFYQNDRRKQ